MQFKKALSQWTRTKCLKLCRTSSYASPTTHTTGRRIYGPHPLCRAFLPICLIYSNVSTLNSVKLVAFLFLSTFLYPLVLLIFPNFSDSPTFVVFILLSLSLYMLHCRPPLQREAMYFKCGLVYIRSSLVSKCIFQYSIQLGTYSFC